MKIYTKTGDTGETGLFGGSRVRKNHPRVQVYGSFDELNSFLGVVLAQGKVDSFLKKALQVIQNELFQVGAELATPAGKKLSVKPIDEDSIQRLETEIDSMEAKLKPLKTFILPGGSLASAQLHVARTVCRRGERELVSLRENGETIRNEILIYINRLSDHLFVCARYANLKSKTKDIPWISA